MKSIITLFISFSFFNVSYGNFTIPLVDETELNTFVDVPDTPKLRRIRRAKRGYIERALAKKNLEWGSPIYIRVYKKSEKLELWVEDKVSREFVLFRTYSICALEEDLGPKLEEGDDMSPEGFYYVTAANMNPWSDYHLAFNIGYPNRYDRMRGRTGSFIMVHGECSSSGCFAMEDYIEEIYLLADAALRNGQRFFRVHVFPFQMTDRNMARYRNYRWYNFWRNLREGHDFFMIERRPPNVEVDPRTKEYVFNSDS